MNISSRFISVVFELEAEEMTHRQRLKWLLKSIADQKLAERLQDEILSYRKTLFQLRLTQSFLDLANVQNDAALVEFLEADEL